MRAFQNFHNIIDVRIAEASRPVGEPWLSAVLHHCVLPLGVFQKHFNACAEGVAIAESIFRL